MKLSYKNIEKFFNKVPLSVFNLKSALLLSIKCANLSKNLLIHFIIIICPNNIHLYNYLNLFMKYSILYLIFSNEFI